MNNIACMELVYDDMEGKTASEEHLMMLGIRAREKDTSLSIFMGDISEAAFQMKLNDEICPCLVEQDNDYLHGGERL